MVAKSNGKSKGSKKRHSPGAREKVCLEITSGKKTVAKAAEEQDVSDQTIRNWLNERREKGFKKAASTVSAAAAPDAVAINSVPTPLILSLADGASLIGITADELLHYGALGKIRLCIPVRADHLTVSSATAEMINADLRMQDPASSLTLVGLDKVDYLLVEAEDCKKLTIGGFPARGHFSGGYTLLGNDSLLFREPTLHRMEDMTKKHYFHVLVGYMPAVNPTIDLSRVGALQYIQKSMLMVAAKPVMTMMRVLMTWDLVQSWPVYDLQSLVKSEMDRKPVRSGSPEEFAVHENRSSLLIGLDQAAFELWGDFNPIKSSAFNTTERVAEYLAGNFGFPKIHAERGASMIFPSTVNSVRSREQPHRAAMLQDLIDMWEVVCSGRQFQKGEGEAALYARAVEDWFNGVATGLAESLELRKSAATITMPDNAPFNRSRPKK